MTNNMQFWLTLFFIVLASIVTLTTAISLDYIKKEKNRCLWFRNGWSAIGGSLILLVILCGAGVVVKTGAEGVNPEDFILFLTWGIGIVTIITLIGMVLILKAELY